MSDKGTTTEFRTIQGAKIEVIRRGKGSPLLLLLGEESALELESPFVAALAEKHSLIIPQAPGFGRSERPDWISSPDDLAYFMLDFLDAEGLRNIPVVGLSLGGWIAMEMAVKDRGLFSRIALVGPIGIKVGGPYDRDLQDIWTLHPEKVAALKWHDISKGKRDYPSLPEEEVAIHARNIESFARFCWEPYMHNPKLKGRLHRVTAPTLVLWGENDGVASTSYGKAYAEALPKGSFGVIAEAGHYPQIEQPAAVLAKVEPFLA